jgi:hypothetical protein
VIFDATEGITIRRRQLLKCMITADSPVLGQLR